MEGAEGYMNALSLSAKELEALVQAHVTGIEQARLAATTAAKQNDVPPLAFAYSCFELAYRIVTQFGLSEAQIGLMAGTARGMAEAFNSISDQALEQAEEELKGATLQ